MIAKNRFFFTCILGLLLFGLHGCFIESDKKSEGDRNVKSEEKEQKKQNEIEVTKEVVNIKKDTFIFVGSSQLVDSSPILPVSNIRKCVVEITPEHISYFIVIVDEKKNWRIDKMTEKFDRKGSQVNAAKYNSEKEEIKAEVNALLDDINKHSYNHRMLYFVSYQKYKDNERIKEIESVLLAKGFRKITFISDEINKNDRTIRPCIQYLLNQNTHDFND